MKQDGYFLIFAFVIVILTMVTGYFLIKDYRYLSLAPVVDKFECGESKTLWTTIKAGRSAKGSSVVEGILTDSQAAIDAAELSCMGFLAMETDDPNAPYIGSGLSRHRLYPKCPNFEEVCPENSLNRCKSYVEDTLKLSKQDISFDCTSQSVLGGYRATCTCKATKDILNSIILGCAGC